MAFCIEVTKIDKEDESFVYYNYQFKTLKL